MSENNTGYRVSGNVGFDAAFFCSFGQTSLSTDDSCKMIKTSCSLLSFWRGSTPNTGVGKSYCRVYRKYIPSTPVGGQYIAW